REAIFNSLGSHYDLNGARVVDCFAGTGALGIEAVSRGAAQVTFIERDKHALEVLKHNIDTLGIADRSTIMRPRFGRPAVRLREVGRVSRGGAMQPGGRRVGGPSAGTRRVGSAARKALWPHPCDLLATARLGSPATRRGSRAAQLGRRRRVP
ncbi:MAG: hypothetical protein RLZZ332_1003, partial [Actinomycetota bacterium]